MCCYCPWPGREFCVGPGVAGGPVWGTAGGGAVIESTCPVIGAIEEASNIAPITIRINGYVFEKSNTSPRTSCNRNNTPMVISTAGPINPRIVHRGQRQPNLLDIQLPTFHPVGYGTSKAPRQSAAPARTAGSATTETNRNCAAAAKLRCR